MKNLLGLTRQEGKNRNIKSTSFFKAISLLTARIQEKLYIYNNLTTSNLTNWIDKVGTTSKSDVKQKEKKP